MSNTGKFLPFYLAYQDPASGNYVSASAQATAILSEAKKLVAAGAMGVAITYSANYGQTLQIAKTYAEGGYDPKVNGSNQAAVMASMLSLLGDGYRDMQKTMRIAPITTMTYEADGYGKYTHQQVVENDLANIKALLDAGWTVLGWQNQDSGSGYAVGGGVAGAAYPKALSALVQAALAKFAEDYS